MVCTICTCNARTLASESSIVQARIGHDVIGLAETRRHHPFNAVYDTGEGLFLGTCDNRGVGCVGVLVNTSLSMNIGSFEQQATRIGRSHTFFAHVLLCTAAVHQIIGVLAKKTALKNAKPPKRQLLYANTFYSINFVFACREKQ
uniref:Acyl-CoA_dh_N domain-containing protein n=1 Tax=Angiostrongylus cantonensis TaxID=6313 RepID=A0A0K0DCH7_ANGCA